MKVPLHPCFILHQRPYRETSLILELFSRDHGKLSVVARGGKRRNSRIRHLLQPNQRLNIAWSIRREMGTLNAIEADGLPYNLKGKWLIAAFYLNELIMRLLHRHEAHPELYDVYGTAFTQLHNREPEQQTLRIFEKHLLYSLGYGLILDHEVESGKPLEPDKEYCYLLDHGPVLTTQNNSESLRISGRALQALDTGDLDDQDDLGQVKRLMRFTLQRHLGEKPLATRELYQAFLRNKSTE